MLRGVATWAPMVLSLTYTAILHVNIEDAALAPLAKPTTTTIIFEHPASRLVEMVCRQESHQPFKA